MLQVSEASHAGLMLDLAASRPKAKRQMTSWNPQTPPQVSAAPTATMAVASAGGHQAVSSCCDIGPSGASLPGRRPGAAALALAAKRGGGGSGHPAASGPALLAPLLGDNPPGMRHDDAQRLRPVEFVSLCQATGCTNAPAVPAATTATAPAPLTSPLPLEASGLEGPGPPIPAESPLLQSPRSCGGSCDVLLPPYPVQSELSAASPFQQPGAASPMRPGQQICGQLTMEASNTDVATGLQAPQMSAGPSLTRSRLATVLASVRLAAMRQQQQQQQPPGDQDQQQENRYKTASLRPLCSTAVALQPPASAAVLPQSVPTSDPWGILVRSLGTVSAPDPTHAALAAAVLAQHHDDTISTEAAAAARTVGAGAHQGTTSMGFAKTVRQRPCCLIVVALPLLLYGRCTASFCHALGSAVDVPLTLVS
jgi:hypothetical protein